MGKDDKEDSGFGFKDKAKAVETLRLLEQHEPNYRRLTVRGLLGRAKRTLTMTKAEDKKKNISEAIEVFENWLSELEASKGGKDEKKPAKKDKASSEEKKDENDAPDTEMKDVSKDLPSDKVPNLGFKDNEAVEATFKELEGRDPEYQKFAIKGLIGSAKRVLTCTRDETKLENIKAAIAKFEKFLDDYDSNHLSKQNNAYLSLGIVNTALKLGEDVVTEQQKSFIAAYAAVNGEYKRLRTVPEKDGGKTWDIVRNAALTTLKGKHADIKLFNDKKEPTKEHLELLLWAYSPEPSQVKKLISETKEEKDSEEKSDRSSRKRNSSTQEDTPSKKQKE